MTYVVDDNGWTLTVTDNGVGLEKPGDGATPVGLGTSIVEALANRLSASVKVQWDGNGTRVTVGYRKPADLLLVSAA